jgi:hypothetical protein
MCSCKFQIANHCNQGFSVQVSGVSKQMREDRKRPATSDIRPELMSKAVESESDWMVTFSTSYICLLTSEFCPLLPDTRNLTPDTYVTTKKLGDLVRGIWDILIFT